MKSQRGKAWRNLMVAAINAGLEQRAISLMPEPEKKIERNFPAVTIDFDIAGRKAIAYFSDAGFDEIFVNVMLEPSDEGRESIQCGNIAWCGGPRWASAVAAGWLERRNGRWLQGNGHHQLRSITDAKAFLAALDIEARGYEDRGKFMF